MKQANPAPTPPTFSTQEELEALLLEGLDSGPAVEAAPKFWADIVPIEVA